VAGREPDPADIVESLDDLDAYRAALSRPVRRWVDRPPTVLVGCTAWLARPAAVASFDPKRHICPGCGGVGLPPTRECVVCHGGHPMQAPDRGADWDGTPALAGGTGPAKTTARKSRKTA
jgi:hypothetical protein